MSPVHSALIKAGLSAAALAVILFRMHRSNRAFAWFGITRPPLIPTLAFVALSIGWCVGTDLLTHWRGPWDFRPWQQAPFLASVLRVIAVCLLGPVVEELLFRGVAFSWLRERMAVAPTIALTAVGWSLLHYAYDWWVIAIIAVQGVWLGLARWRTGSVFVPIAMHIAYNLYAVW